MPAPENLAMLSRNDLPQVIAAQQRQIAELRARVEALQAEVERLKREGQRQAAPFAKGRREAPPKKPGRKPGEGRFCSRAAPPPATVVEPPITVPVMLSACPACGGQLEAAGVEEASVTDLAEEVRPPVRRFQVAVARCRACSHRVRGQHPALAPDQYGVTAHRLGERVMAHAHVLHYGIGVPVRKVSQCSKNARGAQTFAAFTSVVRTLVKTGAGSVVDGLLHVFHSAKMPDASAEVCP